MVSLRRANIPLIPAESNATEVAGIPSDVSKLQIEIWLAGSKSPSSIKGTEHRSVN